MRKLVPLCAACALVLAACAVNQNDRQESPRVSSSMSRKAQVVGTYLVPNAEQPVVLVELWLEAGGLIDFSQFRQESSSGKEADDQVAYDEYLLSEDGSKGRRLSFKPLRVTERVRVAFFLHYPDYSRPLQTPVGPVELPRPSRAPSRLAFVEYIEP